MTNGFVLIACHRGLLAIKSVLRMIWNFVYVVFVVVCIFLVITVLLQPGKSGGLGAAFGGGGNTVFGASGGTPVFRRMTSGAAICFMVLSLLLAWHAIDKSSNVKKEKKVTGLDFSESQERDLLEIPESAPAAESFIAPPSEPAAPAPAEVAPAAADIAPTIPAPSLAPSLEMPGLGGGLLGNDRLPSITGSQFGIPTLGAPSLGELGDLPVPEAPAAGTVDAAAVEAPSAAASAVEAPSADAAAVEAPSADAAVAAPSADAAAVEAPAADAVAAPSADAAAEAPVE